ncbi:hypothetical protein Emag_000739 [Eimeria magna]
MAAARPLPALGAGAAPAAAAAATTAATAAAARMKLCSSCSFSRPYSLWSRAVEIQEGLKWRLLSAQQQQQQPQQQQQQQEAKLLRSGAAASAHRTSHAHAREAAAAAAAGSGGDACVGAFASSGLNLLSEKHRLREPQVFWAGDSVWPTDLAAAAAAAATGEACEPGRQHPAAFAAVAATAADGLQLLKDPLWLATLEAAHACVQRSSRSSSSSSSSSTTCEEGTEDVLAGLREGTAVAAAIRAAAAAAGDDSPLMRLQAALLVSQASELLHAVGASLDCSAASTGPATPAAAAAAETAATAKTAATAPATETVVAVAAAAEATEAAAATAAGARALAHALDLWQLRLAASSFSLSLLTAAAVGATAWKPHACSTVSGAAAATMQQPSATWPEALPLLQKQLHAAADFVASLFNMHPQQQQQQLQQLQLRCLWVLQQAQQLASQLASPVAATAAAVAAAAAAEAKATASAAAASPRCPAAAAAEVSLLPHLPRRAERLRQPHANSGDSSPSEETTVGFAQFHNTPATRREAHVHMCAAAAAIVAAAAVAAAAAASGLAEGYRFRVLKRQHEAAEEEENLFLRVSWQQLLHRLVLGRGPQARWGGPPSRPVLLARPVFLPTVSLLSFSYKEQPAAAATAAAAAAAEGGGLLQQHAAKLHALLAATYRLQLSGPEARESAAAVAVAAAAAAAAAPNPLTSSSRSISEAPEAVSPAAAPPGFDALSNSIRSSGGSSRISS